MADKKEIEKITSPIKNQMNAFEIKLKEIISKDKNFLFNHLENFMFSNQKRLRPLFTFLFSEILKINSDFTLKIALITELIHSSSLIHDDIIDCDKLRRNQETFNYKFNSKIAVLEGDFLLALALELLSETTLEVNKIFAKRIKKTIQGEIKQNEFSNKVLDLDEYYIKTFEKTGNLFFCGLEALFSLKKIDEKLKENLLSFLKNYCLAFQIKNDLENFLTNKTDLQNGNYTLPVIYFCLENNKEELDFSKCDFSKYIEKSKQKIEELKECSIKSLEEIENSPYKNSLIELTKYTLRS